MFWAHEIRARKTFGPTKYPQRHDGTRPTRPTVARDRRNLADPTISHHNEICSSRHEQACLMRLRFERTFQPDDGRSISQNVASLNILIHYV